MAALLDGRHRWGDAQTDGATRSRTCLACGRVVTWESFVPDIVLDEVLTALTLPLPLGWAPRSFVPVAVSDAIAAGLTSDPILPRLGFRRGSGPRQD